MIAVNCYKRPKVVHLSLINLPCENKPLVSLLPAIVIMTPNFLNSWRRAFLVVINEIPAEIFSRNLD